MKTLTQKTKRAEDLMMIAVIIMDEYHTDILQNGKIYDAVIKHEAYERFNITDLNDIEISYIKKIVQMKQ